MFLGEYFDQVTGAVDEIEFFVLAFNDWKFIVERLLEQFGGLVFFGLV
ncbi:hypothetical protein [Corynebacterium glutamicum]|nr:hypothetical protein [Corynebacterium glutamicum]